MRVSPILAVASLTAVVGSAALSAAPSAPPPRAEPVVRTIYVTVTDREGAAVPDLTPADFVVKEGGKEREVLKAAPATQKMRLAVMAEERLLGDGGVRNGLFEFMERLQPTAEIAFIAIGLRNTTIVNYTSDLNAIVAGLNGLSLNPPPQTNVSEGILDISRAIEKDRHERPVIVLVAASGGQAGGASANEVLNQVRQSGAGMFAVTITTPGTAQGVGSLADDSNREQVIGDGAKQSGGRRIEVTATIAVGKGLQQVASDLSSQYVVQYALPDGVKPDRRLNVSLKRRGLSMRAPSLIPDR
jgi:hypothetical protein